MNANETDLIGQSPAMSRVRALIERVAPTEASVLVVGESGSGKELVAQSIHQQSLRRERPFLAVNCGALPPSLIEAELFGYEKGSFTGALRLHHGLFERADGGTLFLDEITEMPAEMQTRLLRLVETRHLFRVGGSTEVPTNVRIIAATNRCPARAVQDGALREDLHYRLAVFPIEVPPLRERGDDVRMLADFFLAQLNAAYGACKRCRTAPCALCTATDGRGTCGSCAIPSSAPSSWPMRNSTSTSLTSHVGASTPADHHNGGEDLVVRIGTTLASVERALIEATLNHFQGNKRQAAMTLGCSQKTLYNKLNLYDRERTAAVG